MLKLIIDFRLNSTLQLNVHLLVLQDIVWANRKSVYDCSKIFSHWSTGEAFVLSDFLLFMPVLINILRLFSAKQTPQAMTNIKALGKILFSRWQTTWRRLLQVMQWQFKFFPLWYLESVELLLQTLSLFFAVKVHKSSEKHRKKFVLLNLTTRVFANQLNVYHVSLTINLN